MMIVDDAVGRLSGCVALARSLIFLPYFQLSWSQFILFRTITVLVRYVHQIFSNETK